MQISALSGPRRRRYFGVRDAEVAVGVLLADRCIYTKELHSEREKVVLKIARHGTCISEVGLLRSCIVHLLS